MAMLYTLFTSELNISPSLAKIYNSLIIRLSGEISIKSEGVKRYWQRKLAQYIRNYINTLGHRDVELLEERSRLYLFFRNSIRESHIPLIDKIRHTFGISSISLAKKCDSELDAIKVCSEELVREYLKRLNGNNKVKTFGIVCKKSLSPLFGTTEVRYEVGRHIKETFNLSVNLTNPDLKVNIDVRENHTYIYFDEIPCYGGLPFGVQDKLIVLMSGGPDSTLAAWMALRRGSPIIPIYYDFGIKELREKARKRVIEIARVLFKKWTPVERGRLYIIPLDVIVKSILSEIDDKRFYYVLLKRFMFKIAYYVAKNENATGIVSGEILGEHASQTAWNLNVISTNSDFVIHRPVFGFDKADIFRILKIIDKDLYEISSSSIETCKEITRAKPTTQASLNKVLLYEEKILNKLADTLYKVIEDAYIIEL